MRVLLVEDESLQAETIRRGLAAEGFVVEVVGDGISGLWAATEHEYDVVVLDVMLPGMHGYAVLQQMRERQIWTPVLMLTAKDGDYDQTDAFDLGADDYLSKPFSFPVLVARLRSLIRRGAPPRPVAITVGSLRLDPVRHQVTRDGRAISLSPREFALLTFLMRRPGEVLSKAEILDNVWDPVFNGGHNVVEVYIGYLRRKIDVPFGLSTVRTVRGTGYVLDAD
ncbi:response regulator transcription factor [Arthrobacter sp. YAF34]|jgi:two-component system OmpR family response regulator|uniref:response regulator transcription factor n=1 Tax=Arthrobacter sp. YAF34 TaxID=3233083 RepID=UPI003F93CC53